MVVRRSYENQLVHIHCFSLPCRHPAAAAAAAANMPESAESHAYSLTTNRNCVIELTNLSNYYWLSNPK